MTQTDNVAETNHPEQPGNAWVRSTFDGRATRTVVVRCPPTSAASILRPDTPKSHWPRH